MHAVVSTEVFAFLRTLGGEGSTYSTHMKDARFTIPNAGLLAKVVDMLDGIPMENRDTNGDLYEYMLSKIASAGQNGQFRTPRHIIALMVQMMAPTARDEICDPACGTAGFLVAASEYLRREYPKLLLDDTSRAHFHNSMFHGYDFDGTMLRIGSMNMLLHGIEAPDIRYRDSLSDGARDEDETYSLILANPPFARPASATIREPSSSTVSAASGRPPSTRVSGGRDGGSVKGDSTGSMAGTLATRYDNSRWCVRQRGHGSAHGLP